ncbi:MAG: nucleotidyltransferase family protein [Chitinophaga sp.]|uniref:nucleotidyltransferase family protein n=1 Tax=Chitinophaga sp. TaxID=1869181 RepID=UPI0025C07739|nr:nucleotidyltransferase family protein [Chitinophaga sp.]MBV8254344.1 nucleotidyltransferase family protein [Chitinophaga sp.]
MVAIILAGGFGTRLRSVVKDQPKPLAQVGKYPFLYYLIHYLKSENVNKFIFSLGYLHEQITSFLEEHFQDIDYKIVIEEEPLGTGGAVKLCAEQTTENEILLVNADTFFELKINSLTAYSLQKNADCVIALTQLENFDRYGVVKLDDNNKVLSFEEKKKTDIGLINTGLIFFNKEIMMPLFNKHNGAFSLEKDILEPNIESLKIYGYPQQGYFIDIGIPEDYFKANNNLAFFESLLAKDSITEGK